MMTSWCPVLSFAVVAAQNPVTMDALGVRGLSSIVVVQSHDSVVPQFQIEFGGLAEWS